MSAITQMLAITSVLCDAPGCVAKAQGPGKSAHVRSDLRKKGWACNDKTRSDLCPLHTPVAEALPG